MNPTTWTRVRKLFESALELDPARRSEFLEREAGSDPQVRREVERLLAADSDAGGVVERVEDRLRTLAHAADPAALVGTVLRGYTIERVIASGGMGTVYLAAQEEPRRRVALKVLRQGLASPTALRRFQYEAECLARLSHPSIARVFESGSFALQEALFAIELPFFAMEFVEGALTITDYVKRASLALPGRVRLLAEVCAAIHHGHQKGVIHRDLKPGNVLVDGEGRPKIIDFGVARAVDAGDSRDFLTSAGEAIGTLQYMSPEQLSGAGGSIDTRCDVYALGLLAYEVITGARPYELAGRSLPEAARVIAEGTIPALNLVDPHVPLDLSWIVQKALEKDRDRRYGSASDLARDFERWLGGEPVQAGPPSRVYRARKFLARHRAGTIAAAVVFVVPVVAALVLVQHNESLALANARYERLADARRLDDLEREAAALWPTTPAIADDLASWLARAGDLDRARAVHRARLIDLDASLRAPHASVDTASLEWQREVLVKLLADLEHFAEPETGTIASVRKRHAFALSVGESSLVACSALWTEAIAEIADGTRSPRYRGLRIVPQLGLVPLGRDPASGLQEFAHLESGAPPGRDADGRLVLEARSGLVLVLIPGGMFAMGARTAEAIDATTSQANVDPQASTDEGPVNAVELAPYFLSKYEMTGAQWERVAGSNPSTFPPAWLVEHGLESTLDRAAMHPVAKISWTVGSRVLAQLLLDFPTEAQWEYAARGGTSSVWWTGDERESLRGMANIADRSAVTAGVGTEWKDVQDWPDLDDGTPITARVGSLPPNPFGLHEVIGNVFELCRDAKADYEAVPAPLDGERAGPDGGARVMRGGAFYFSAEKARSANRSSLNATSGENYVGVRPARRLTR